MELISVTGWPVRYITHHVGLGTLLLIFGKVKSEKPTGLLAKEHLTEQDAKAAGLRYGEK